MSSSEQTTDNPVAKSNTDNSETSTVTKNKKSESTDNKKPSKRGSPLTLILIIVLLASSAGGYYFWLELQKQLQKITYDTGIINSKYSDTIKELDQAQADIHQQQQLLTQLSEQLSLQNNQLMQFGDSQKTLISSTKNIFDITHRNQTQWLLSEVSYLLSLANQRLIVSRDIKTAVAALKAANNRLHDLSDPGLLTLRKTIANEIAQLNLLKLPDINGIAFNLDNLTLSINELPFKSAQQKHIESKQASEKVEISSLADDNVIAPLWDRLKSLVTIKKHQRDIQTTETPLEKSDIDNQLRYRLETSRVALINKSTAVFQHEIGSALKLVSVYYNQNDSRVAALLNELNNLSKENLLPTLPDITGSWTKLQRFIAINNATNNLKKNKGSSIK